MKKRVFGRQLNRTTKHRGALLKSLMRSLVLYGRIKTTEAKAKAIRAEAEKLLTLARNKGELARPSLRKVFSIDMQDKMIHEIAPKFRQRAGGYTRIARTGPRLKDNAPMVFLEWVEQVEVHPPLAEKAQSDRKRKTRETDKIKEEKPIKERKEKEGKDAKDNKTNQAK